MELPRTGNRRAPFADHRKQHGSGEEGEYEVAGIHPVHIITGSAAAWQGRPLDRVARDA
jgi:hypothetical protein